MTGTREEDGTGAAPVTRTDEAPAPRVVTAPALATQPVGAVENEIVTEDVVLVPVPGHDHEDENEAETRDQGHRDEAATAAEEAAIDRTNMTEIASPTDTTSCGS
jgi:hypothetical protein